MKTNKKKLFSIGYLYGIGIFGTIILANAFGIADINWYLVVVLALFLILLTSPILESFNLKDLLKGKFKK